MKIYEKIGKRSVDVVCSLFGLLVCAPLFVIVGMLIKIYSKGPVFFIQNRVGLVGKEFQLIKFRTMYADEKAKLLMFEPGKTDRITPIGSILRKTKIDELPQLWNVLRGDMSLVGPRPEVPKYVELFKKEYSEILKEKPGITDFATIEFRDEEKALEKYGNPEEEYVKQVLPRKIELYKKYLMEKSLTIDMKLIFFTIWRILKSE